MPTAEPQPPTLRAARAAVFAALCVLVGAIGHDAFSAGVIPVWALLIGGVAVFAVAAPLTRRERGLPSILALLAAVQIGLHELFGAAQRGGVPMVMPARTPPRGVYWCGHTEPPGVTQVMQNAARAAGDAATHHDHAMTVGMWFAHVAAALVAAWWLRRGEAAVWSLARTLGLALVTPLAFLAAAVAALAALVTWTPSRQAAAPGAHAQARLGPGRLLRFDLARRGPPTTAAAFA